MLSEEQKGRVEALHWFHRIELAPGYYTPGIVRHGPDGGDWPTTRFLLPPDLTGKSVLDVGCADGFFSFEAERRGARLVIAADTWSALHCPHTTVSGKEPIKLARELLNSKIFIITEPAEVVSVLSDVVLLYGVIYHSKRPLDILEAAARCAKETLIIESAVADGDDAPCLRWRPNHNNDPTNQLYPNRAFIQLFAARAGFEVTQVVDLGERVTWRLDRRKEVSWP